MVKSYDRVTFHDNRNGRFRKAGSFERNRFFKVDTLSKGMANFVPKTGTMMAEEAQDFAAELVEYAQQNAPWQDRTGEARAGLSSEVEIENEVLNISLFHTVSYGLWLEIRWGGKYAIIIPTVEQMGARLFDRFTNKLSEIQYYE